MKQLLIFILAVLSISGYSQSLTVAKNGNTVVFQRSGQETIAVGTNEFFDCYRNSNDTTSIIILNSRMNNAIWNKANVISVGGVSCAGKGAWTIAWMIKDLVSSLNSGAGASGGTSTVSGTVEVSNQITGFATEATANSLFKAGQSIGNTSFGISGTLPSFATTPTFNVGTFAGISTETTLLDLKNQVDALKTVTDNIKLKTDNLDVAISTIKNPDSTSQRKQTYAQQYGAYNTNQTQATAGFTKITDGTNDATIKASSTASVETDKALVVDIRPTTALFGSNTPTVTAITTAGNTITTTNCIKILIENQSLTTNATVTYGGQVFTVGFKGNSVGYSNYYAFDACYDTASRKYSPFATLVVDAAASNIFITKIFAQ